MENAEIVEAVKQGKLFIYPTDTIYGLGCDATNKEAVARIKELKGRDKNKPMSVIAPNVAWIKKHCVVDDMILEKYLPGQYTLILTKLRKNYLTHVSPTDSLGVRIPDNEFTVRIQASGLPFITTSVNLSGERPYVHIDDIPEEIKAKVDIVIKGDEKRMTGKPSALIINGEILERK